MNYPDSDSSDDDSILQPRLTLKRTQLANRKHEAPNDFSSTDDETDDEEIATLIGSQAPTLTNDSQASPGIATQPSTLEKPSRSAKNVFALSKAPHQKNDVPTDNSAKAQDQENNNPMGRSIPDVLAIDAPDIVKKLELKPDHSASLEEKAPSTISSRASSGKKARKNAKKLSKKAAEALTKNVFKNQKSDESKQEKDGFLVSERVPRRKDVGILPMKGKRQDKVQESKIQSNKVKATSTDHHHSEKSKLPPQDYIAATKEKIPSAKPTKSLERYETENGRDTLKTVYAQAETSKSSSPPARKASSKQNQLESNESAKSPSPVVEKVAAAIPLNPRNNAKEDEDNGPVKPKKCESATTKAKGEPKPTKKRSKTSSKKSTNETSADSKVDNHKLSEESMKPSQPLAQSIDKPKKQPPKKISKKMALEDQVAHRLFWSFKPHTLRSLADDLKTTETTLEHCFLSLIDKGLVIKKDFMSGKGRVKTLYWANHDTKSKAVNLGTECTLGDREKTKHTVQTLQTDVSTLKAELSQTLLQPSNTELTEHVAKAESEIELAKQRTDEIKSRIEARMLLKSKSTKKRPYGAVSSVDSSPRSLKRRINHMRDEWKNRKAKCNRFLDLLADGLEKKPKDVIKLLEIDTDEMNDVVLPPKHNI